MNVNKSNRLAQFFLVHFEKNEKKDRKDVFKVSGRVTQIGLGILGVGAGLGLLFSSMAVPGVSNWAQNLASPVVYGGMCGGSIIGITAGEVGFRGTGLIETNAKKKKVEIQDEDEVEESDENRELNETSMNNDGEASQGIGDNL